MFFLTDLITSKSVFSQYFDIDVNQIYGQVLFEIPSLIRFFKAINGFVKRMGSGGRHAKYVKDLP